MDYTAIDGALQHVRITEGPSLGRMVSSLIPDSPYRQAASKLREFEP